MKYFLIFAIALLSFSSCKKYPEDDSSLTLSSPKARLTSKWILDKVILNGSTDLTSTFSKQILEFKRDDSYVWTEMGTSTSGEWSFQNQKEELDVVLPIATKHYTIIKLTGKELWLSEYNGINTYEYHFIK